MKHTSLTTASLVLMALATPLKGDDIDIFKGGGAQDPAPPNVLILLDNTSNWSANNQAWSKTAVTTKCEGDPACLSYVEQIFGNEPNLRQGQVQVGAIQVVLNELVCASETPMKVSVGLMMLKSEKGTCTSLSDCLPTPAGEGGFIRRAVAPLDTSHCTNLIGDLTTIFDKVKDPSWKASASANYGGAMFDVFKYFGGYTNPAGALSNTKGEPEGHIGFGTKRFATSMSDTKYPEEDINAFKNSDRLDFASPLSASPLNRGCGGGNYLLLVGNGYPQADSETAQHLRDRLAYTWDPGQFYAAGGNSPRLGDVWARFLATTDVSAPMNLVGANGEVITDTSQQTVITSALNVYNSQPSLDQTKLLQSMAKHGGGTYYEVGGNLRVLIESMRNFFLALNAANQTFSPASLPYKSGSGGLHLNQVYLGMFRPDKHPLWYGNLRLYQFGLKTNLSGKQELYVGDRRSPPVPVQSAGSGFIEEDTISFWTQNSSFWNFRCGAGNSVGDSLLCGNPISASDLPDGPVVEKGGAAQRLRESFTSGTTNATRTMYTDNGSVLIQFNEANVTAQLDPPGTTLTTTQRNEIVRWARGVDVFGENTLTSGGARPSMIGDILHAEPASMNYGTAGCNAPSSAADVVVFAASNHGVLHAIQGGREGAEAGQELWSYIPSDHLNRLKRIRDNFPGVTFPAPVPETEFSKPYMIDGHLSLYTPDLNGDCVADKVWLFLSMRRGGRFIYALDVTDKKAPKLLWKRTHQNPGFSELGQSWSKLQTIRLPDGKPYVLFGAGYDPKAEDRPLDTETGTYGEPPTTTRSMGRGIFVVDAETGALKRLLQDAALTHSVPSDLAVLSDPSTGFVDRAYVGDTGGNLWRIDFRDPTTSKVTADAGKWTLRRIAALANPATRAGSRGFLYPPDIARCGGRDVVLIGSGDREKPFDKVVQNRFYMIHDHDGTGGAITESDLTDVSTGSAPDPAKKGWFVRLGVGEKTVGSALTQAGMTYFPTNQAGDTSGLQCDTSLGIARAYAIDCRTGQFTINFIPGGGFPPSPAAPVIEIDEKTAAQRVLFGLHTFGESNISMTPRFSYLYRSALDAGRE